MHTVVSTQTECATVEGSGIGSCLPRSKHGFINLGHSLILQRSSAHGPSASLCRKAGGQGEKERKALIHLAGAQEGMSPINHPLWIPSRDPWVHSHIPC